MGRVGRRKTAGWEVIHRNARGDGDPDACFSTEKRRQLATPPKKPTGVPARARIIVWGGDEVRRDGSKDEDGLPR